MNRVACDNALLAACEELHSKIVCAAGVALLGMTVGGAWYLLVALRAGGAA